MNPYTRLTLRDLFREQDRLDDLAHVWGRHPKGASQAKVCLDKCRVIQEEIDRRYAQ